MPRHRGVPCLAGDRTTRTAEGRANLRRLLSQGADGVSDLLQFGFARPSRLGHFRVAGLGRLASRIAQALAVVLLLMTTVPGETPADLAPFVTLQLSRPHKRWRNAAGSAARGSPAATRASAPTSSARRRKAARARLPAARELTLRARPRRPSHLDRDRDGARRSADHHRPSRAPAPGAAC